MPKIAFSALFIAFLALMLPPWLRPIHAQTGTTYYVSGSGNDANSGTYSAPFQTMSKAESVVHPGGTITVLPGTYPSFTLGVSGTAASPISVVGDHAVVSGGTIGLDITGNYLNVSGFEVTGAVNHGLHIVGQHIKLSDFVIHDNVTQNRHADGTCGVISGGGWGSGLSIKVGSDDVQISNGKIYDNCGEGMAATRTLNTTVSGVTSYDNYSANLYIDNSNNVTLDGNFAYCTSDSRFYRNGSPATGILIGEETYSGWEAQLGNITLTNNISNGCQGINFWGAEVSPAGLVGATIANNTLWNIPSGAKGVGVASEPNNANIRIVNNLTSGPITTGAGITASNNESIAVFQGAPGADPLSFTPVANSPGVNAGVNVGVTTDFFGKARDSHPDVGAIEYGGTVVVPSPSTSTKLGDANGDGKVDIFDYNVFIADYGKTGAPGFSPADFDRSGKVDIFDYNIFVENFGK